MACARLNKGRSSRRPWAGGACDFLVFFFSVEAPPTGNVVPGEVYTLWPDVGPPLVPLRDDFFVCIYGNITLVRLHLHKDQSLQE